MTLIVGVHCKNGVVIGADGASTFSTGNSSTIEQPSKKINIIGNKIIVAGTGSVGFSQRFNRIVEDGWTVNRQFDGRKSHIDVGKELCAAAIKDAQATFLREVPYGALVAFPLRNAPHLCEFEYGTFQPEFKNSNIWYCSMGGGQPIADPWLAFMREAFWSDGPPNCNEGIFAVTWTLLHCIKINPGGVNDPIQIAVLSTDESEARAYCLDDNDIEEQRQSVEHAIEHVRNFTRKEETIELPKVPATDTQDPPHQ